MLATIDISSFDPLGTALNWATVAVIGVVSALVALALSIVALVRSRRAPCVAALLIALLFPGAAAAVGIQTGVQRLNQHVATEVQGASSAALSSVDALLAGLGPPGEPIRAWLQVELLSE